MPRIRSLKIGFFHNEELATLPHADNLLFAGLWLLADREGRLEDRPGRIKAQLFPYERDRDYDVDAALDRLAMRGFILRYNAPIDALPHKVIQVLAFLKHQNPHIHEQLSVLPPHEHHTSTVHAPCSHRGTTRNASLLPGGSGSGSGNGSGSGSSTRTRSKSAREHSRADKQRGSRRAPHTFQGQRAKLLRAAYAELDRHPQASDSDLSEAVKRAAAALRVTYRSDWVTTIVDAVRGERSKAAKR